jgi:biopolymer transport protein ExbB
MILPRQAAKVEAEWRARPDHTAWCARQIRQTMISRLNGAMTAGFPVMQVLVPMAPLLGLIGTVSGMLDVFDSMALRGNADAKSMASGVSAAMICTMTGLAVSITGLYPVHYFRTKANRETELLADKLSF